MDTIIRSELEAKSLNLDTGVSCWNKAAPTPETCLGGKNTPSIG
jgi:hypothetical protein